MNLYAKKYVFFISIISIFTCSLGRSESFISETLKDIGTLGINYQVREERERIEAEIKNKFAPAIAKAQQEQREIEKKITELQEQGKIQSRKIYLARSQASLGELYNNYQSIINMNNQSIQIYKYLIEDIEAHQINVENIRLEFLAAMQALKISDEKKMAISDLKQNIIEFKDSLDSQTYELILLMFSTLESTLSNQEELIQIEIFKKKFESILVEVSIEPNVLAELLRQRIQVRENENALYSEKAREISSRLFKIRKELNAS